MNRTLSKLLLVAALALAAPLARAEPLAVVVDRDNPKADVSTEELKSLWLGKRTEWPDGARVVAIDLDASSPLRAAFLSGATGMSPAAYQQYWVDQQVRGAGSAPKTASAPASAMKLVARIRGAVAYVPASQVDASVKVLTVNGKRPGAPGYPLLAP